MLNRNYSPFNTNHNIFLSLVLLFLYVVAGLFVGQFVGLMLILPFYDFDFEVALMNLARMSEESSRIPILILQGCTATFSFIIAPYFYFKKYVVESIGEFVKIPSSWWKPTLLVVGITFSFMFVNSYFIEWNKEIVFPEFLQWFEEFAKQKELEMERATKFLTSFQSFGVFVIALFVIGVLPGIGEELLFRGLFQNIFSSKLNIHLAIWLTAALFSAFHFQFYGFVPRMLLGALFGYVYYISGSLFYAIVGHFFNNAFTLLMLYLHQSGMIGYDILQSESAPWLMGLGFFLICCFLMYIFAKKTNKQMEVEV